MSAWRSPSIPVALMALALALPAIAGEVPLAWAGRWPFEIADDAGFRRLAGDALAKDLGPLLETGPKAEAVAGRWLVVEGCRPHSCDTAAAFVVIDARTGGVKAWMTTHGVTAISVEETPAWTATEPPPEIAALLRVWRSGIQAGR